MPDVPRQCWRSRDSSLGRRGGVWVLLFLFKRGLEGRHCSVTASEKVRITDTVSVEYKEKLFLVSEAPVRETREVGGDLHP